MPKNTLQKLTKTKVQIKVRETTKLSQILYWNFVIISIMTPLLHYFLQTSNYIGIGLVVCCGAYMLSEQKNNSVRGTSPLDFTQTLNAVNKVIKK